MNKVPNFSIYVLLYLCKSLIFEENLWCNQIKKYACDSGETGLVIFVAQNAENQRRSKEENWELCAEEDKL